LKSFPAIEHAQAISDYSKLGPQCFAVVVAVGANQTLTADEDGPVKRGRLPARPRRKRGLPIRIRVVVRLAARG
jgi:hypothetical protein